MTIFCSQCLWPSKIVAVLVPTRDWEVLGFCPLLQFKGPPLPSPLPDFNHTECLSLCAIGWRRTPYRADRVSGMTFFLPPLQMDWVSKEARIAFHPNPPSLNDITDWKYIFLGSLLLQRTGSHTARCPVPHPSYHLSFLWAVSVSLGVYPSNPPCLMPHSVIYSPAEACLKQMVCVLVHVHARTRTSFSHPLPPSLSPFLPLFLFSSFLFLNSDI